MTDSTPIDTSVFTLSTDPMIGDVRSMSAYTEDHTKKSNYDFAVEIHLYCWPENPNKKTRGFNILINDKC